MLQPTKRSKLIVLRVDSPGGSGLASDIIWHAVESANQKKPVVVSDERRCAHQVVTTFQRLQARSSPNRRLLRAQLAC